MAKMVLANNENNAYFCAGDPKLAQRGKNSRSDAIQQEIIQKWSRLLDLLEGGGGRTHLSCLNAAINWAKLGLFERENVGGTSGDQNGRSWGKENWKQGTMHGGGGGGAAGTTHPVSCLEESKQARRPHQELRDFVPELLAKEITIRVQSVGTGLLTLKSCIWLETLPIEMQVNILQFLRIESWRFQAADLRLLAERIISCGSINSWVLRAAQTLLEDIECPVWYVLPEFGPSAHARLSPFPWMNFGAEVDERIPPAPSVDKAAQPDINGCIKGGVESVDGVISNRSLAKRKALDDGNPPKYKKRHISHPSCTPSAMLAGVSARWQLPIRGGSSEKMSLELDTWGIDTLHKSMAQPSREQEVMESKINSFGNQLMMENCSPRGRVSNTHAAVDKMRGLALPAGERGIARTATEDEHDAGGSKTEEKRKEPDYPPLGEDPIEHHTAVAQWRTSMERREPDHPPTDGDFIDCQSVIAPSRRDLEMKVATQGESDSLFQRATAVRKVFFGDAPLQGSSLATLAKACALFREFSDLPEIFRIVRPWNVDDEITLLLCTECISETDSYRQSAMLLKGLLTSKLRKLDHNASRALVSAVLLAARMQPWAVMNEVIVPLIQGTASKNGSQHVKSTCKGHSGRNPGGGASMPTVAQCEVIGRVVKEALPKAMISDFLNRLLDGIASSQQQQCSSGEKNVFGGEARAGVSDSVIGLVQTVLNMRLALTDSCIDKLVDVLCAASEGMTESLKFASTAFSLVTKYGEQLLPHNCRKLESALSLSSVFLSKSALAKLESLSENPTV